MPFAAVNASYLAATCADSLLPPVFPIVARELGLDLGRAGFVFALLTASIALGNIVGGLALSRLGPRAGVMLGLGIAAAGGAIAAVGGSIPIFLASQGLMGFGSGVTFASALFGAAVLAGGERRGLAMGWFGVAFSGGLAAAAFLAALGGTYGWRMAFASSAIISVASGFAVALSGLPSQPPRWRRSTKGRLRALGTPLAVGGTAMAAQYGMVAFFPTLAVATWGVSPVAAALALAAARVLSVPAKLVAGGRADRGAGPLPVARAIGFGLDIPRLHLSSSGLLEFRPGDLFAVELPAFEAHVKDPDETVGELAERLVVCLSSSPEHVVVATGTR